MEAKESESEIELWCENCDEVQEAVISGRKAHEAKLAKQYKQAVASSPLTAFLYE